MSSNSTALSELERPEFVHEPLTKLVEPADFLFCYGTLMRSGLRFQVLENERFEGEAYITDAQLFDTPYGFPALFLNAEGIVWGEAFKIVHREVWATIDRIEGGLYHRVARRIHLPGKAPMTRHPLAQVYVANRQVFDPERLKLIQNGRWENNANA